MAANHTTFPNNLTHHHLTTTTTFRWQTGRKIHLRRRKLGYVRLGGKKAAPRGNLLVRIFSRIRLRRVKQKYSCTLKKLKQYYRNTIKELTEASAILESFQQRILMETSFAVPVMGVSFSNYPSATHSDRPRSIFI